MPGAARGNGVDTVHSLTGVGRGCNFPMDTVTGECSTTVFVEGTGIVREGDIVGLHPFSGCGPDISALSTFSSTVVVEGKGAGRVGDMYGSDNTITSGSSTVIIG